MQRFSLFLLLLLTMASCFGQDKRTYSISAFSQATALPSLNVIKSPVHPGLRLAVNWSEGRAEGREHYGFRELALGGFHHDQFQTAAFASYSFGYHRNIFSGLYAEGLAGLGYLHSFSGKAIYKPVEGGGFEQKTDFGRPQALISLQLGLGYQLPNTSISPFIRYGLMIQGPFAPDNGFPVNPMTAFHLGASFNF